MQDVQSRTDKRGIAIQHVGVKNVHLPFLIKTKEGGFQSVLARIRFTVELPEEYKGTHMSRFLEILMPWSQKPLAEPELEAMLREALKRLDAQAGEIRMRRRDVQVCARLFSDPKRHECRVKDARHVRPARLQAPGSSQVKFCKARLMQHLFSGLHRVERRDGPL